MLRANCATAGAIWMKRPLMRRRDAFLAEFEESAIGRLASLPPLDSLAQSDLEEEMSAWLEGRSVAEPGSCRRAG